MNMNKYYLVPVTASAVKFENTGLRNILKIVDPELSERENERLEFKYGNDFSEYTREESELLLKKITDGTSAMFKMRNIPEKLVVVRNESSIYELGTKLPITVENDSYLEVFEVSGEKIVDFFVENDDYSEQAANFFQSFLQKRGVRSKK